MSRTWRSNQDAETSSEDCLLRDARIPDEVRGYLRAVVDHSNLRGNARQDVLSELVAHFEDGLAAGRSANDLLDEFGEGRLVGTLIRRTRGDEIWAPKRIMRLWRRTVPAAAELSSASLLMNGRNGVVSFVMSRTYVVQLRIHKGRVWRHEVLE